MLQIVTGMYFRDVELYETTHRAVLYTNAWCSGSDPIDMPIGRFSIATALSPVTAVTIEVTERLEAVQPDGQPEFLRATGGTELVDDVADVFAFSLNVSCSRNLAMLERLVPQQLNSRPTRTPWSILRRTFDPSVFLQEKDTAAACKLASKLLALRRGHFEAAMRSIRSVVDASLLVSDDPGLAYTLFVASLESLAQFSIPTEEARSWDTYDGKRRKVFDAAVKDARLTTEQAATMRNAVLEIDQLSLRRRFIDFTLAHIEPSYYRDEATAAVRPIRATDLANALDVAYRLRSRNIHFLEALAPELWAISDRADTLRWEGRSVLSLEGLNRLCRHVIAAFVDRGPTDLDTSFNYREHLPGIVKMQLAPQYWIWQSKGFSVERAPLVLDGFIELLVETLGDPRSKKVVDLSAVLEKVEVQLERTAESERREPMIALYVLWHVLMETDHHRPRAKEIMERYRSDLDGPGIIGFAVRVLASHEIEWSVEELRGLVQTRHDELKRGRGQPIPTPFDVALLLETAMRVWDEGRLAEAVALVSQAVDAMPGNESLMALEDLVVGGERPTVNLFEFVVGSVSAQATDDPSDGKSPDAQGQHGQE